MAKRPAKITIDPLSIALRQLAFADKESARALRNLCIAIMEPVQEPDFVPCEFTYENQTYNALLTSNQRQAILTVVQKNGAVPAKVSEILAELSCGIADSANKLMGLLGISADVVLKSPIQLGCCTYEGGQTANLTKAQCAQYNGSWDPQNPNCSPERPKH